MFGLFWGSPDNLKIKIAAGHFKSKQAYYKSRCWQENYLLFLIAYFF
jgi:hypothetical protein